MKKLISLFVIVTMIVACMTFTVSANEVTSETSFVTDGITVNKLVADISAMAPVELVDGNHLAVDLNGHKWTCSDLVLIVTGGSCTVYVYDSSAAKTGALISSSNDCVKISNGELTLENITVKGGDNGMDAVIAEGGKVTLTNCVLSAGKAGINADNNSEAAGVAADITVNGGTFANYDGVAAQRNCAIELRKSGANGPKVTLDGAITFENNKIMIQDSYTKAVTDGVVAGSADASVTFSAETAGNFTESSRGYKVTTITYAYTGTGTVETEAPTTEAPATDAETEAPATDAETEAPATDAETKAETNAVDTKAETNAADTNAGDKADDEGSSILPIIIIVAVVAVAAVAAVIIIKKKK